MAFCSNCGAQLNEGSNFCTSCGTAVAASVQTAQTAQAAQPQQAYQQPQQAYQQPYQQQAAGQQAPYAQGTSQQPSYQQDFYQQQQQDPYNPYQQVPPVQPQYAPATTAIAKYQKLGGWLLFFVVLWVLSALSGLGSIVQVLGTIGSVSSQYFIPLMLDLVGAVLAVAISVVMVMLVTQRNPSFLRWYQILSIVEVVVNVASLAVTAGSGAAMVSATIGGLIGGAIGLLLMTLYFCKSVRVRTYMGSTEYQDRALFKLGAN